MEFVNKLTNLFQEHPLWQIIWLFAFIIWVIAFLHKKDKKLYLYLIISQSLWVIHFFLMWLFSWAFVNLVSIFRWYIALKYKHIKYFIYIFILFYICIWIINYNWIISLLPPIAGILWTIAILRLSNLKWRLLLLICSMLWLIYNYIWGSIWWIITEIFMIIAWLITICRLIISYKKS